MLFIQLTGLSGAGKSTIAHNTVIELHKHGVSAYTLDGDDFRKKYAQDLGFSAADRRLNILRMAAFVQQNLSGYDVVILAAINPYNDVRLALETNYNAKTVYINCPLKILIKRDTKGLYKKALLPDSDKDKITNLSGINDPFEFPTTAQLVINTEAASIEKCIDQLTQFILTKSQVSFERLLTDDKDPLPVLDLKTIHHQHILL